MSSYNQFLNKLANSEQWGGSSVPHFNCHCIFMDWLAQIHSIRSGQHRAVRGQQPVYVMAVQRPSQLCAIHERRRRFE